jgi:S1-C subfamily serine protease
MGRSIVIMLLAVVGCATDPGPPPTELGNELTGAPPPAPRPRPPTFSGGVSSPSQGTEAGLNEQDRPDDTIFRDELVRATNNGSAAYLLRALQLEVYRPNGRFIGWRVGSTWPDDPSLCTRRCDLQEGDIILTVNGRPVERPEQLSALMENLATMERLEIQMIRDGTLRKRSFAVAERME